ncbi:MAG TPA: UDP-3-O-(3-hydroxymyristoyl)glucosamine N-acyltransferase [Steroidobacteraceae bacterium]|nr:UDP-3-O-(3-hydroxymyristoyl)glucosamine N-acyltransferase [Steroidobacteraceae bacterium]
MGATLGELAVRFGCELRGDPDVRVTGVGTLEHARPDELAFLANPRYRRYLESTRAAAVVLAPEVASLCPVSALLARDPYATYARIAQTLYPVPEAPGGVHPSAVVASGARIDPLASVGALAVIEDGVVVGPRAFVGPGCILQSGAQVGAHTRLVARVTLCHDVVLGERCTLHPGVVIGADGFGFAPDRGTWTKVPQIGTVRIGDDVEIGANTTIDRGAIEDTVIEEGVKLDNQIQIGHNVSIGAHTAIAACVGISGSAKIGRRCMIAGAVGIAGHLSICDDVVITGLSMVSSSINKPGVYSSGLPVQEAAVFRRNVARFRNLDRLLRARADASRASASPEPDDD